MSIVQCPTNLQNLNLPLFSRKITKKSFPSFDLRVSYLLQNMIKARFKRNMQGEKKESVFMVIQGQFM